VRAAAAEQLALADSASVVDSLRRALGDDDPDVVVASVEALEFAGDASVVPALRALLDHPNARVREVAERAIDLLE
jgi:HEAT repeat protein